MALLRVALRLPNSRPWNPDLKLRMARLGLPGALFSIHESAIGLVSFWVQTEQVA
jgi:hypothetical protein